MTDSNIKHRFIGNFDLNRNSIKIDNETVHDYATNVLKLQEGDFVMLADGTGWEAKAKVVNITDEDIVVDLSERVPGKNEPEAGVVLFCSIVKRGNFEEAARMAAQVGVEAIVPVISDRTIKRGLKEDRLERIILNAAEQSQRSVVPELFSPVEFREAFNLVDDLSYVFVHPGKGDHLMKTDLDEGPKGVFIGPEGGWSREEVEFAKERGLTFAHLGKPILRNETAAAVASYILINR